MCVFWQDKENELDRRKEGRALGKTAFLALSGPGAVRCLRANKRDNPKVPKVNGLAVEREGFPPMQGVRKSYSLLLSLARTSASSPVIRIKCNNKINFFPTCETNSISFGRSERRVMGSRESSISGPSRPFRGSSPFSRSFFPHALMGGHLTNRFTPTIFPPRWEDK